MDWCNSNDTELLKQLISELDMVNEVTLFSDKLSNKDVEKMEKDYAKELLKSKQATHTSV